ncbi:hypothetical protein D3C76_789180 [compost metagenome]|jgi:hypothetical protein
MARYLADTFQCPSMTYVRQLAVCCALVTLLREATFLIFCIKCLWDSVRHFLGRRRPSQQAPVQGLCAGSRVSVSLVTINYFK